MEVIISHNNTDLDGLASMIAAKKLYPDAELVFAGEMHRNVKEFMALHRDTFHFWLAKDIPIEKVTGLILVDNKNPDRIGELKKAFNNEGLTLYIYDHHPQNDGDVHGSVEFIEQIGATTSLLVKEIREKGVPINSFEATIFTMGIYEDTGCLTFPTTTAKDAEIVAFLLSQGANLALVADFIERPLSKDQKSLLNKLILASDNLEIRGVKVLLTQGNTEEYIDGLGLIVHKIMDLDNIDIAIALVFMEDRIHLVARSREAVLDVRKIVSPYNGGGHATAASATIREQDLGKIVTEVKALLDQNIKPELMACNLMSAPVKMITLDKSIDEASKILLRYGHTGLPVVDGQSLVGIISRRDIEKAKHHGLGHAPVKGFMSNKVVTVKMDTPLWEVQELMIENNIGRLPVMDDKKIVGIISRTDLLKTIHGDHYPGRYEKFYHLSNLSISCIGDNLSETMATLPVNIRRILRKTYDLAEREGYLVYVVGGFVRDLILQVENCDIDLVVEGDGPTFAKALAEFLGGRVKVHEKFSTAMVLLPDHFRIDVATARTEYYEYPAALPEVEESSLKQDLYRRDFTINAMAIRLSDHHFGEAVDYFGGRRDLDQGLIRILYNLSFVEDPTRILRAVRFEQRYDFKIEEQTLMLLQAARKEKLINRLSGDRIREELKHILDEDEPLKPLIRLQELAILDQILPQVFLDKEIISAMDRIPRAEQICLERFRHIHKTKKWLPYLIFLLSNIKVDAAHIVNDLRLTKDETNILLTVLERAPEIIKDLKSTKKNSERAVLLEKFPLEGYIYLNALIDDIQMINGLWALWSVSKTNGLFINGNDIKKLGYKPGPHFKTAISLVKAAKLNGDIKTKTEEINFLKEILNNLN